MRLLANDLAPGAQILGPFALRSEICGNSNEPRSSRFPIQFLSRTIAKSHFTSIPLMKRLKMNAVTLRTAKRIRVSLREFCKMFSFPIESVCSLPGPSFGSAPRAQVRKTL